MCEHPANKRIVDGGFSICVVCGTCVSTMVQFCRSARSSYEHNPIRTPYDRRKRFVRLLANCYGNRVSRLPDSFFVYLAKRKCRTVQDVYNAIRASREKKHKRYDALGFLAIGILGVAITPLCERISKWADLCFVHVQERHRRLGGTFPCYSWLIEQVLTRSGRTDLLPYINLLKCKRRRFVYTQNYGSIFADYIPITTSQPAQANLECLPTLV